MNRTLRPVPEVPSGYEPLELEERWGRGSPFDERNPPP
jgi:hypothetical protein